MAHSRDYACWKASGAVPEARRTKSTKTFHQSFGAGGVWFFFEVFHMASIRKKLRADGSFSFHVQIRVKGTPPVTETFERKTDAVRWAEQTEAAIRHPNDAGSDVVPAVKRRSQAACSAKHPGKPARSLVRTRTAMPACVSG